MDENRVVPLRQPDAIDDPLQTFCDPARNDWFSRRWKRSSHRSWPGMPISSCQTGASALSVTGTIPFARSRRDRTGRCDEAEGARSRGDDGGRTHPLFVVNLAEMGATDEEPRCSLAGPLSAWRFHRLLSGGADGFARQGGAEFFALGDRSAQERLEDDYRLWQARDLSARRYVYVWADGVYLQARMEPQAECMLVLIGATPEGRKELLGLQTGMRESGQSWKELLVDLKARGLSIAPDIAVGDGALGFWKALEEAFPSTRHQRCWQHKSLNVLDKLPKKSPVHLAGALLTRSSSLLPIRSIIVLIFESWASSTSVRVASARMRQCVAVLKR